MKTETIDLRTRFGKDISKKVRDMKTEYNDPGIGIHHGLVQLRFKDVITLLTVFNCN